MGEVVDIEDQKPHVVIEGLNKVHCMPLSGLEKMASGELKISDTDEFDDYLPTIIQEWLDRD